MIHAGRLRELMERRGLSQSELGRRIGVSQSAVGKLVRGEAYGTKYLVQIARELRCAPDYLTGESNDPGEGSTFQAKASPLRFVPMGAVMPSEPMLAKLIEELLQNVELGTKRRTEVAHVLAEKLPAGLGKLNRQLIREAERMWDV